MSTIQAIQDFTRSLHFLTRGKTEDERELVYFRSAGRLERPRA